MRSFCYIVPIKTSSMNRSEKKECLDIIRSNGIDRILLLTNPLSDGIYEDLANDIAFFTEAGLDVTVWMGETLGHGVTLAGQTEVSAPSFTPIVGPDGKGACYAFCPLDPDFRSVFLNNVKRIVLAGAKSILLDDDFRFSNRTYGLGCGCKRHRAEIARRFGQQIEPDALKACVCSGKRNPIRSIWYRVQGDTLRDFAAEIRRTVDEIDPTVRVGLCAGQSTWDADGVGAEELALILAGETRPFLRLCGAPYWAWRRNPEMTGVFEIVSMCLSFCADPRIEIVAEGDAYPRPRYHCPSSYLELFDDFLLADGGFDGEMKYMMDYYSSPGYETGYLVRHRNAEPMKKELSAFFESGTRTGVRVYEYREKLADANLFPEGVDGRILSCVPYPHGGHMLAACGIPTTYQGVGCCGLAWGENARYLDEAALSHGLILDFSAAVILTERGIDTGLRGKRVITEIEPPVEFFEDNAILLENSKTRYLMTSLAKTAIVESTVEIDCVRRPLSYRYVNPNGQKFLVYLFDSLEWPRSSGWLFSYERQHQLYEAIRWFSGETLPAFIGKEPFLYQMMKRNGDVVTVGFFNTFADTVVSPDLVLGGGWAVRQVLNTGCVVANGKLTLSDILPYSFAAVSLSRRSPQKEEPSF